MEQGQRGLSPRKVPRLWRGKSSLENDATISVKHVPFVEMLVCCYQTPLPDPGFPICCGSSGRFTAEQPTARRVFHHRLSPSLLSLPKTRKPGQTAAERLLPHGHEECRFYNQTSGTSMAFTDSFCVVQMTSTH